MRFVDWGTIEYQRAWEQQEALREKRRVGLCEDTIIFCDHPRVFTTGRRDCSDDWKATPATIQRAGIDIIASNRGGKITYHGPGQLVGYCIIDIAARGYAITELVHRLESVLIAMAQDFGVVAARDSINPGVWVAKNKIAALGLHVSQNITQHGFAFNYAVDLTDYQYVIPCGLTDRGVTSIKALTGHAPARDDVINAAKQHCERVL